MTKQQTEIIENCSKRIKELASLENCNLDEDTKKKIRPYLTWFDIVATLYLDELVRLDNEPNSYCKRFDMEQLVNNSYRM